MYGDNLASLGNIESNDDNNNPIKLLEYQQLHAKKIIKILEQNGAALDTSESGIGKTYIASYVCKMLNVRPIVLCCKNAVSKWRSVLEEFEVDHLLVSNYESAAKGIYTYKNAKLVCPYIKIKTGQSCKWKVPTDAIFIFDEVDQCTDNLLLSAKDTGNKILMLSAKNIEKPHRFAIIGYVLGIDENIKKSPTPAETIHSLLYDKKNPLAAKLTVAELGDKFPNTQITTEIYEMKSSREIQKIYETITEKLKKLKEKGIKQLFLLSHLEPEFKQIEMLKVPTIIELAKEYIDKHFSVVIFVNHRETLEKLLQKLKKSVGIYDEQNATEREKNIEEFQSDKIRIIIVNMKTGGKGISLCDVNGKHPRVSLISPTTSVINLIQMLGRVCRSGKTKSLQRIIFAANTPEEKLSKMLFKQLADIPLLDNAEKMRKLANDFTSHIVQGGGSAFGYIQNNLNTVSKYTGITELLKPLMETPIIIQKKEDKEKNDKMMSDIKDTMRIPEIEQYEYYDPEKIYNKMYDDQQKLMDEVTKKPVIEINPDIDPKLKNPSSTNKIQNPNEVILNQLVARMTQTLEDIKGISIEKNEEEFYGKIAQRNLIVDYIVLHKKKLKSGKKSEYKYETVDMKGVNEAYATGKSVQLVAEESDVTEYNSIDIFNYAVEWIKWSKTASESDKKNYDIPKFLNEIDSDDFILNVILPIWKHSKLDTTEKYLAKSTGESVGENVKEYHSDVIETIVDDMYIFKEPIVGIYIRKKLKEISEYNSRTSEYMKISNVTPNNKTEEKNRQPTNTDLSNLSKNLQEARDAREIQKKIISFTSIVNKFNSEIANKKNMKIEENKHITEFWNICLNQSKELYEKIKRNHMNAVYTTNELAKLQATYPIQEEEKKFNKIFNNIDDKRIIQIYRHKLSEYATKLDLKNQGNQNHTYAIILNPSKYSFIDFAMIIYIISLKPQE